MAYMNQEKKAALAPGIKAVLKKYKMKGSISVQHYSALVVTLKSGELDLIGDYISNPKNQECWGRQRDLSDVKDIDVNVYHIDSSFTGKYAKFLKELLAAMQKSGDGSVENYNNSDIMTDYFDVGWYNYIKIGKWDKPYELVEA